jgi:cytochrome P450
VGRPFAVAHIQAKRALDSLAARASIGASLLARLADELRGPAVLLGPRGRELARAIALLDERVQRMIDDRRRAPGDRQALLTRLLGARDDESGGAAMDDSHRLDRARRRREMQRRDIPPRHSIIRDDRNAALTQGL